MNCELVKCDKEATKTLTGIDTDRNGLFEMNVCDDHYDWLKGPLDEK